MSLEDRLKSLEEAVRENTAALLGKADKKTRADKDEDAEEKPRSRRSSKDEDAEEKPRSRRSSKDEDADEKPRSRRSKDDDDDKPAKKGKLTSDDVRKAYADYLGPKDGKSYDTNAEFVEAVLDEVGADTLREIKEDDFAKVMHWLELKKDGKKKIDFDNDLPDEEAEEAEEKPRRRRSVDD